MNETARGITTLGELAAMMPNPDTHELTVAYVREHLPVFKDVLHTIPIAAGRGSISVSEAFWLWRLTAELQPPTIVESGSANGWSAFILSAAAPEAEIHCFDPFREPDRLPRNAVHHGSDWTARGRWPSDSLAFFDDHTNQGRRLRQVRRAGLRNAVFHDVYRTLDRSTVSIQFLDLIGSASRMHTFDPVWDVDEVFTDRSDNAQMYRWLTWVSVDEESYSLAKKLRASRAKWSLRNPLASVRSQKHWTTG